MTALDYLSIFVVGGFLGWVIDTSYRSWDDGKYAPGTWMPFFSIIYGIGVVFVCLSFSFLAIATISHILVGTLIAIFLELFSGITALLILNRRFWDYSMNSYNFYGFIDAKHSFYWFILISFYYYVHPYVYQLLY